MTLLQRVNPTVNEVKPTALLTWFVTGNVGVPKIADHGTLALEWSAIAGNWRDGAGVVLRMVAVLVPLRSVNDDGFFAEFHGVSPSIFRARMPSPQDAAPSPCPSKYAYPEVRPLSGIGLTSP
jgi:hypothetical protein